MAKRVSKNLLKKAFHLHLQRVNQDLNRLLREQGIEQDARFLAKLARDILDLEMDAGKAYNLEGLEEQAGLIHHLLSTPWGAPFVEEAPLLEAASTFSPKDYRNSSLFHFAKDFARFGRRFDIQLTEVFLDLEKTFSKKKSFQKKKRS